jgi:hypothetical protein
MNRLSSYCLGEGRAAISWPIPTSPLPHLAVAYYPVERRGALSSTAILRL